MDQIEILCLALTHSLTHFFWRVNLMILQRARGGFAVQRALVLRWAVRAILAADAAAASVADAVASAGPACNDDGSATPTAAAAPLASGGGWLTALAATPGAAAAILADTDTRADAAVVVAALSYARAQNLGDADVVSVDADESGGNRDEDDIVHACDVIAGLACCGLCVRARSGVSGGRIRKRRRGEYECSDANSHQGGKEEEEDDDENDNEDEDGWALFPAIAQLNHTCVRAAAEWHVDGDCATLRARRQLCAGDEVTVSYLGAERHRSRARPQLQRYEKRRSAAPEQRTGPGRGRLGRDRNTSGTSSREGEGDGDGDCDKHGDDNGNDDRSSDEDGGEDEPQEFRRSRRAWLYESFVFFCATALHARLHAKVPGRQLPEPGPRMPSRVQWARRRLPRTGN
jgi:hypothetical protein